MPLANTAADEHWPAISGERVVWQNDYAGKSVIYGLKLGSTPARLTNPAGDDLRPQVDGDITVFERRSAPGMVVDSDIYMYRFSTGAVSAVSDSPNTQYGPDVSGDRVVWYEFNGSTGWDIMIKDLATGGTYQLTNSPSRSLEPRVSGNIVVFSDDRYGNFDIFFYDLSVDSDRDGVPNYRDGDRPAPDPAMARITNNSSKQSNPDISGRKIVWTDWRDDGDIYNYDLDNPVSNGTPLDARATSQHSARISGNLVVWTDWRNGDYYNGTNSDIYAHDLAANRTLRITTDGAVQSNPAISGDRIVWTDWRNGSHSDIYLYQLGPSGSLSINGGSAGVNKRAVTLNLSATDFGGSGISQMRFKNDGGAWSGWYAYAAAKSWTLAAGDGTKKVWAQFKNTAGKLSDAVSDTIILDTVRPAARMNSPTYSTGVSKTTIFVVRWRAADPSPSSGIASYDVRWRLAGSRTWTAFRTGTTRTYGYFKGRPGRTYYFQARAKDKAGNYSAWKADRTIVPFNEGSGIRKRRGFGDTYSNSRSVFYLGTVRYSKRPGDYIVYRFTGKSVGLISTKNKYRSKARIYLDGRYVKTIDAYSARTRMRQALFFKSWRVAKTHYIRIVNVGNRARFDVDGLAVGR